MNQGASQPISDVYHFVIIKKLLDLIFNILLVFICRWEIQTNWFNNFLIRQQGYVWLMVNALCAQYYDFFILVKKIFLSARSGIFYGINIEKTVVMKAHIY
jgi:hypothetical protein